MGNVDKTSPDDLLEIGMREILYGNTYDGHRFYVDYGNITLLNMGGSKVKCSGLDIQGNLLLSYHPPIHERCREPYYITQHLLPILPGNALPKIEVS